MSNFIELTRTDGCAMLMNKHHITTVSKSLTNEKNSVVRFNNGQYQEVIDPYDDIKFILGEASNACR